jgi:hypothetical protein
MSISSIFSNWDCYCIITVTILRISAARSLNPVLGLWSNCVSPPLLIFLLFRHIAVDKDLDARQVHAVQSLHEVVKDFVLP